jgi:Protein of unknown function (DUF3501)
MRAVRRDEILDFVTYGEQRDETRRRIFDVKKLRRIHAGEYLTFLFENHDTIRYQIQEMVLAEKMVKDAEIGHEIETYNEVGGGRGELGCVLLIEIDDPAERQVKLQQWLDLPKYLYVRLADGRRIPATYDQRQVGDTRVSSVQYLKFPTGGEVPVAIGADHPDLTIEAALSEEQKKALAEDLRE